MSVNLAEVEELGKGRCIGIGGTGNSGNSELGQSFEVILEDVGVFQPRRGLMIDIDERREGKVGHRTVFKLLYNAMEEDSWDECHWRRSMLCAAI